MKLIKRSFNVDLISVLAQGTSLWEARLTPAMKPPKLGPLAKPHSQNLSHNNLTVTRRAETIIHEQFFSTE